MLNANAFFSFSSFREGEWSEGCWGAFIIVKFFYVQWLGWYISFVLDLCIQLCKCEPIQVLFDWTCNGLAWLTICHLLCNMCLFFGDVSCKRDPSTYLSYVFAIYNYYRKEYCILDKREYPHKIEVPLIVNTPGWVKGKLNSFSVVSLILFNPVFVLLLHVNYFFSKMIEICHLLW